MLRATFGYHSVEQVEILVKVENWLARENGRRRCGGETERTVTGDPFHNVDVLGQHDNRLEVTRHEGRVDERTAQVERFSPSIRLRLGRERGLVRRRRKRCRCWCGRTLWSSWSTVHSSKSLADRLLSLVVRGVCWPTHPRELKKDIFAGGGCC